MSRAVVFVTVEGPTDRDALSDALTALADPSHLHIQVMHGDFTSSYGTTPAKIKADLGARIQMEMKRYRFNKSDVVQIIHLMDTDGVFIPPDRVIPGTRRRTYRLDCVESSHVRETIHENAHKAHNMDILAHTPAIMGIPYRAFYFSRNLEHVLHNIAEDVDDDTKADLADEFARKFGADAQAFVDFFQSAEFNVPGDYAETWAYIQGGTRSLERHCNFSLALGMVQASRNPRK